MITQCFDTVQKRFERSSIAFSSISEELSDDIVDINSCLLHLTYMEILYSVFNKQKMRLDAEKVCCICNLKLMLLDMI